MLRVELPAVLALLVLLLDTAAGVRVEEPRVSATCRTLRNQELNIPEDEVELIFVRHGLSLNNVFGDDLVKNIGAVAWARMAKPRWTLGSKSSFKRGYVQACEVDKLCGCYGSEPDCVSSWRWEMKHNSRDCLLHPDGEQAALKLQSILEQVLPPDVEIAGFFASPMRRTVQTMMTALGALIAERPDSVIGVQPWAHERYKSDSDLAYEGDYVAAFAEALASHLLGEQPQSQLSTEASESSENSNASDMSPIALVSSSKGIKIRNIKNGGQDTDRLRHNLLGAFDTLKERLLELGSWTKMNGYTDGRPEVAKADVSSDGEWAFYPGGAREESDEDLETRMTILRRWMTTLKPGKRYVLVSHGGVAQALFQPFFPDPITLSNLGMVVARFKPSLAEAGWSDKFFSSVATARSKWDCTSLAGWSGEGQEEHGYKERLVDLSSRFEHAKKVKFENGATYSCCCTAVERRVTCKLANVASKKNRFRRSCGGFLGAGYHSWNTMDEHAPHLTMADVGRCIVPASDVPPLSEQEMTDVTHLFMPKFKDVALSDGVHYRCCCQNVGHIGVACVLKAVVGQSTCGKIAGPGFHVWINMEKHHPGVNNAGRCMVKRH